MTATITSRVRALIQDGGTYNVTRLEDLTDEIPALATPTQTQFLIRFTQVPTQQQVSVFAVPGSLVAYVDGSSAPVVPLRDVDVNGNFALAAPPATDLQVTYAWQYFTDDDINGFVDQGRAWLSAFSTVDAIPDGLLPAVTKKAAADACTALARKCTLADARSGESEASLSDVAKSYGALAKQLGKEAADARDDFYNQAGQRDTPAAALISVAIDAYQPRR